MWKLNKKDRKLLFFWCLSYILTSTILAILLCGVLPSPMYGFGYHLLLTPLYLLFGWLFIVVLNFARNKKPKLELLFFWLMITAISFTLPDFRNTFGFWKHGYEEFSLQGMIGDGCREMFFFLSLILTGIIISLQIWRKKI